MKTFNQYLSADELLASQSEQTLMARLSLGQWKSGKT
jgi:hypothetical protein